MNQVIKFPDLRPPKTPSTPSPLPAPSQYRLITPRVLNLESGEDALPTRRRRLFLWFGVAVALHAALLLAIWLSPPLRLKWSPSPDAWVPVISLPPTVAPPSAAPVPASVSAPPAARAPVEPAAKTGRHRPPPQG